MFFTISSAITNRAIILSPVKFQREGWEVWFLLSLYILILINSNFGPVWAAHTIFDVVINHVVFWIIVMIMQSPLGSEVANYAFLVWILVFEGQTISIHCRSLIRCLFLQFCVKEKSSHVHLIFFFFQIYICIFLINLRLLYPQHFSGAVSAGPGRLAGPGWIRDARNGGFFVRPGIRGLRHLPFYPTSWNPVGGWGYSNHKGFCNFNRG